MTTMTTMTTSECLERNLIEGEGFYSPFVALGDDGRIYVGDRVNLDSFATVAEAIAHCECAVLTGDSLTRAQRAHENDYCDNDAAEFCWHCDAKMQLDALRNIQ